MQIHPPGFRVYRRSPDGLFDTVKFPQKVIGLPNGPDTKLPIKKEYVVVIDVLLTFLLRVAIFNPPSQLYSLNLHVQ